MGKEQIGYKVFVWSESVQIIQMVLDPGHTVTAGAIFDNWIDDGIIYEAQADHTGNLDQGVFGQLMDSGKKKLGRVHHQLIYFTNSGSGRKNIALAAPLERQILPIPLSKQDGNFFCHKKAFICAESGIDILSESGSRPKSNFLGLGISDWLELSGDGIIFVHVGGSFKKNQLKNQNLKIDRRSIVGFVGGITYDRGTTLLSKLNRSDTKAYFQSKLSGSGTVYLQSKPFKMPKNAQSLTHDIRELVNTKALRLYKGNMKKIKSFQWSKLQDLMNKENLQNTLQRKINLPDKIKKLTTRKG